MKVKTIALVLTGALALGGVGVGAVACSSSSSSSPQPGVDSGLPDTSSTGTPDTGNGNPDNFVAPTGDAGVDCGSIPKLHPPEDAGPDGSPPANIFCPFGGGDAALYCEGPSQHCCEPSSGDSVCEPTGTACPTTGTDWQCQSASDCASGSVCCGQAPGTPSLETGCGYYYVSGFTGTTCTVGTSCPTGTFQICEQSDNSDCASGTCTPLKAKGAQLGWCAP